MGLLKKLRNIKEEMYNRDFYDGTDSKSRNSNSDWYDKKELEASLIRYKILSLILSVTFLIALILIFIS